MVSQIFGRTAIFCGQNLTGLLVTQPRYFYSASWTLQKIQGVIRLVLQQVCDMSAVTAANFTRHSARKTMISVAQAAVCPWEQCLELGHWSGCSLDSTFLLPVETLRRKRALETMSLPKR